MYDEDHRDSWCANESLVLFETEETSKLCAPWEKVCITTVLTINKAFTSVDRDCGERCSEFCESVGYGQDQVSPRGEVIHVYGEGNCRTGMVMNEPVLVSCEDCCDTDLCNANYSVQYYQGLMSKQITGWTIPLRGELEWNKKNNFRFPY